MKLDAENLPPDLRGEDINVQYLDMVYGATEQVTRNSDGSYTVFLNARYSYERWVDSMEHAFNHIRDNDHDKDNVQVIERVCHAQIRKCV
jgi:hypothetical protein